MADKNQWWGYLHTNGNVEVKRFFDQQDIVEANMSDFVEYTFGPFDADSREEAIAITTKALKP